LVDGEEKDDSNSCDEDYSNGDSLMEKQKKWEELVEDKEQLGFSKDKRKRRSSSSSKRKEGKGREGK